MAESGYAMKKLKLSQFIAIYRILQMLKRENSAPKKTPRNSQKDTNRETAANNSA